MADLKQEVRILRQDEIGGPANWVLANYILWLIKVERKSPDADAFGDALLKELDPPRSELTAG
jgi:hypothetical protein